MFSRPDLMTLMQFLAQAMAIVFVASGTAMMFLSSQSQPAALYAVIFFGVAAAFAWAGKSRNVAG